jgi:hypothetical protein
VEEVMGSPVEFKFPAKGVVKNTGYQDADPTASVDALNVFPWDNTGRQRIGQRPGTSKAFATQFGSGQPVNLLMQTTLALDPSTIIPVTQLLNYDFTALAAATDINAIGGANTLWRVGKNSNAAGGDNASTVAALALIGTASGANGGMNGVYSASSVGGSTVICEYAPSLTLGSAYIVRVGVQNINLTASFSIRFRLNRSTWSNLEGYAVNFNPSANTISVVKASTGASVGSVSFTFGLTTAYTFDVRVNGNNFAIFVNGVSKLTVTNESTNSGNTGIGFAFPSNTGSTVAPVINFQVYTGVAPTSLRQTNIIAVAGGNVYQGTSAGGLVLATLGSNVISTTAIPSGAYSQGFAYLVDGTVAIKVNLLTQTASTLASTAGTLPTNCTLAAVWRDRLVLAAPASTPQNFFFSRVGTATDFDYSQTDTAAAFAGNASTAGHIGEPIVALIPFSDDVLYLGGDHNFWAIRGDPADGGSIDLVSDAIGILGANAWCKAPDGTVYFVGTGGLYKLTPGSTTPENISNKAWNEFFRTLNRGTNYTLLAYDRDREGFSIFITPATQGSAQTGIWYDVRTQTLWPMQYPAGHGPLSVLVYDGDGPTDRVMMLGGFDGYIRRIQLTDKDDDGTAISSYIYLGPFLASQQQENLLEWMDIVQGEPPTGYTASDWNCQVNVYAASTVELAAVTPTYTRQKILTAPRRATRWFTRCRGSAFFIKLSNSTLDKTWVLEKLAATFTPAGTVRRIK